MAISTKYGRTYHYPFSPGTTSDDRIKHDYWEDLQQIPQLIHTEKLDGENNCLSRHGVFARSHAAPTISPWTEDLRRFWQLIKNDLGDLEIFLENLYAVHSIAYQHLHSHYHVFGIREHDRWLTWEETIFFASMVDLPVVPVLDNFNFEVGPAEYERRIIGLSVGSAQFAPFDVSSCKPCTVEGIVSRNADGYLVSEFANNVFKYVRKGHVKTDEHWTRNWKRASLIQERGNYVDFKRK